MNKIKELRKKFGYSQQKLASLLGDEVTQTAVSQWENGITSPRQARVEQLAQLFGVSEAEVMGIESPSFDTNSVEQEVIPSEIVSELPVLTLTDEERLIIQHFRGSDEEGRKAIIAVAELEYLRRREKLLRN